MAALYVPPPTEFTAQQTSELATLLLTPTKTVDAGKEVGQLQVAYGEAPSIKTANGKPAFSAAAAPPAIEGWTAAALERTNADGSVDYVAVYSNAMAGDSTTFAKKYGIHVGDRNNVSTADTIPDVTRILDNAVADGFIPSEFGKTVVPSADVTIKIAAGGEFREPWTMCLVSSLAPPPAVALAISREKATTTPLEARLPRLQP